MLVVTRRGGSSRFIGRTEQLALFDDVLAELVEADRDGTGEVLLVAGEAGVGKSRLADEWIVRARAADVLVLRGWCVEHGDDVMPLAPIADVLRDIATSPDRPDELGDLSGLVTAFDRRTVRPSTDGTPSMVTLCDGLLRMLYGLSARHPVLIALEDVHWSDASTRQLLTFLAPRLTHHRVALVLTYRSDELHRRHPLRPFLASLRRAVRPEQIDLPPFTRDELADMTTSISGSVPTPHLVDRLHERSAGNAFFAEELLAGEALGRPSAVLRDAVLARTAGLDEDALIVLRTVAPAGARAQVEVLAAASGLAANRFADAVEAVTAAGLCRQDEDRISFRHELAREIVDDEILTGDRPGVHAALASAMETITPHLRGEIARHWWLAGDRAAALRASVAAARAATEIAADTEALVQLERALELWEQVPDAVASAGCDHVDLLMDAADAAGRARLFGRALALGRRAVAEAVTTDARAAACVRLLPWAWFGTEDDEVGRLLDQVAPIDQDPSNGWTATALAWRAKLTLSEHQHDRLGADAARPMARRAAELARATGQTRAEADAGITLGVCTCIEGKPEGLQEIRAGLRMAKAGGFAMEAGRAYDNLAYYLNEFWRHDEVVDLEPEAMDYCAAAGIVRVQGVMTQARVIRALQLLGRWRDVETRVDALRAEFGSLDIEHLTLAGSWGLIQVRQGRLDGVHELVDSSFARIGDHLSALAPTAVTAVELMAAEGADAGVPDLVDSTLTRILPRFAEHAAELLAAAIRALADRAAGPAITVPDPGGEQDVRRLADEWLDLVGRSDPPAVPPWMAIAEAERARLDDGTSEARWRGAVDAWRDLGAPYENAYTQYRLAEALLTGADRQATATRAEARAMLTDARSIADELEAAPLRDRIDGLAARAHLSLHMSPVAAASAGGTDELGLTEREAEVLRLVAQGYSNGQIGQALFISRKTASVHVSNILRKLGVSNRVEAATRSIR